MYQVERDEAAGNAGNDKMGMQYVFPGYNWEEDPWSWNKPFYSADLRVNSLNYWGGEAPVSWMVWKGRRKLGRLVGLDQAECIMRWYHYAQRKMIANVIILGGIGVLLGVGTGTGAGGAFGGLIGAIFLIPVALIGWARYRWFGAWKKFAWEAQLEVLNTGTPVWMPYGSKQLGNINRTNGREYVWP